jgi:peptide deformylase
MTILNVITAPDPILKEKSTAVGQVDDNIRKLMDDMLVTMYHDHGVGLSAVQVGILQRILVIDLQDDNDQSERDQGFFPLFMANPEIIEQSTELVLATEGCLSLPEQRIEVARPDSIKTKFLDYNNKSQEITVSGWLARAIQHEIDHLNGKLLVDYLSNIKRDVALRKLKKLKKNCL